VVRELRDGVAVSDVLTARSGRIAPHFHFLYSFIFSCIAIKIAVQFTAQKLCFHCSVPRARPPRYAGDSCPAYPQQPEADAMFCALKTALTEGPALQLPDFNRPFVVNCDCPARGSAPCSIKTAAPSHSAAAPSPQARQARSLRARTHRLGQGLDALAALSVGAPVRRPHRPLRAEVPVSLCEGRVGFTFAVRIWIC
jgi:hypothetical protein